MASARINVSFGKEPYCSGVKEFSSTRYERSEPHKNLTKNLRVPTAGRFGHFGRFPREGGLSGSLDRLEELLTRAPETGL